MTKVYYIDLSKKKYCIEMFKKSLPSNALERCSKYKIEEDYLRSLTGWYLVNKYLLEDFNISLNEYNILIDEFGKPYINSNIHFNISHSNSIVCAIISDKECGIDVEKVREISSKDLLCKRFGYEKMTDKEFIKEWTKRESFGKMTGKGVFCSDIDETLISSRELFDSNKDKYYLSYSSKEKKIELIEGVI